MWTIYKLWKTNEHTILKLWTLIKNIIERTHKFPYNILFTFLMDRGRAPNGIGHLMILKEYKGPTLRPPCDAIDDVIIMKIFFFGIIWEDLFISEVKLKLCLIFQNFQNGRHFELATNFFTGSWIYQKDSHEHFRYFELLIDAVAQILKEIYQFQTLTYFVTWWPHQWRHEYLFIQL